ncbi:unnamed protein product [Lampetra fluviatilis]
MGSERPPLGARNGKTPAALPPRQGQRGQRRDAACPAPGRKGKAAAATAVVEGWWWGGVMMVGEVVGEVIIQSRGGHKAAGGPARPRLGSGSLASEFMAGRGEAK